MSSLSMFLKSTTLAVAGAFLCSLPSPVRAASVPPLTPAAATSPAEPENAPPVVNLNTASAQELAFLPGVGERKAEAIVARREKKKFTRPEELMEVKGFGRGIFKHCKPFLRVAGPTTLSAKVHASRKG